MAKAQRRPRKRSDPNQLSLLDYVPAAPSYRALPTATSAADRKRSYKAGIQATSTTTPIVLTAKQAAGYLNLSLATLKSWRAKKTGPAFVKRGVRLIGYLPADLDAYIKGQR